MENTQIPERGWRGSAELWLDAAYQVLIDSGVEAVKVGPLAASLGLSRTSFYWHFADREALLDGLIARWQAKNTGNLIARTEANAQTIAEAVLNVNDCWISPDLFDSKLEFAIRNWALNAPNLAQALAQTDADRIDALRNLFARFGYSAAQSDIRARTIYLTQVGYITLRTDETLALRLQRVPTYVEAFTGTHPTESEVECFKARHLHGS